MANNTNNTGDNGQWPNPLPPAPTWAQLFWKGLVIICGSALVAFILCQFFD